MAVVMEFKSAYGVKVRVLDDLYRDEPIEEQLKELITHEYHLYYSYLVP